MLSALYETYPNLNYMSVYCLGLTKYITVANIYVDQALTSILSNHIHITLYCPNQNIDSGDPNYNIFQPTICMFWQFLTPLFDPPKMLSFTHPCLCSTLQPPPINKKIKTSTVHLSIITIYWFQQFVCFLQLVQIRFACRQILPVYYVIVKTKFIKENYVN